MSSKIQENHQPSKEEMDGAYERLEMCLHVLIFKCCRRSLSQCCFLFLQTPKKAVFEICRNNHWTSCLNCLQRNPQIGVTIMIMVRLFSIASTLTVVDCFCFYCSSFPPPITFHLLVGQSYSGMFESFRISLVSPSRKLTTYASP